ncbi:hypothetical protein [Planococcus beigongshangi]|uniref:hypothetical protein n=1 Tax=Planococcus beigongshangi TaxID=2782536 RepID=UPI00193B9848|nr:hypothetical protein [Planococcus beigongshangi]
MNIGSGDKSGNFCRFFAFRLRKASIFLLIDGDWPFFLKKVIRLSLPLALALVFSLEKDWFIRLSAFVEGISAFKELYRRSALFIGVRHFRLPIQHWF